MSIMSQACPPSLWQVAIFLFHVYKGGSTMFSSCEKYSHGRFKDYWVKIYVMSDFDRKQHILTVFPPLWAKHVHAAFDKLKSSYSMFIKEDQHVRSIVMEGLRITE
jgi:hypothetical protein